MGKVLVRILLMELHVIAIQIERLNWEIVYH